LEPKAVEIIQDLYEATDRQDWARVRAYFADDVAPDRPPTPANTSPRH
jgi:ketosteroid isomerase-like protein